MKRKWIIATLNYTLLALTINTANAQNSVSTNSALNEVLPLREVVLFSSGVGYFGRAGEIKGKTSIPLTFRTSEINDVLKSLVIFDKSGQTSVSFATQDAIARRLDQNGGSVAPTASLGDLLRRFQGATAKIQTENETFEGRILSVQTKQTTDDKNRVTTVEILNVLANDGLRSVKLDDVVRVALLDPKLNGQLQGGLDIAASSDDAEKRTVQLRFDGEGTRQVRAGYLLETPVWKTSYRLVLGDDKTKTQPFLQGWGLVENTTDDDWKNVRLSLVSGRPISFVQDLYTPLYVPRPVVQPQVIGSPRSELYGERVDGLENRQSDLEARVAKPPRMTIAPSILHRSGTASGGFGGAANGPAGPMGLADMATSEAEAKADIGAALAQTAVQAQGGERGELFEYRIARPIDLPKNQSAMVPIIGQNIGGERVSLYNPNSSDRVLSGFRLKNNSDLHLAGGPLTVFQDDVYAGDAQILDLGPGDERLISYAVDLETVASKTQPTFDSQLLSLSIKKGVLIATSNQERTIIYTLRNKSERAKTVLIQQPIDPNFTLTQPFEAKVEKTATEYRFPVAVPANKSVEYKVVSEHTISQTIALLDMNFDLLVSYARNTKASPKLQASLQDLVAKRRAITDLQTKRAVFETELKTIEAEQNRIRQNMAQLDRTSDLYKQYVAKLTAQEMRFDELRTQIATLQEQENAARKVLEAALDELNVD